MKFDHGGSTLAKNVQRDRAALRKRYRQARAAVDAADASAASTQVVDRFLTSTVWAQSASIGLYVANDGELNPAKLAEAAKQQGMQVFLPTIEGPSLKFVRWDINERLKRGKYGIGIPEKARSHVPTERGTTATRSSSHAGPPLDLIVVPLVAWGPRGERLGMGGGYYDRFLKGAATNTPPPFVIGLAYECQKYDGLADLSAPWDVPLHGVLTERAFYQFR